MIELSNDFITVKCKPAGAEMISLVNRANGKEYLWQGDSAYWNGQAPVLFPFVGRLIDDKYRVAGKEYSLPQHGFARRQEFSIIEQRNDYVCFSLSSSPATMSVYPYEFELRIAYQLEDNTVSTIYSVYNRGNEEMYFSVGGHPGFNCPLNPQLKFEDYYMELDRYVTAPIWLLDGPYYSGETREFFKEEAKFNLRHDLFDNDALVFKNIAADVVTLKSDKSTEYVEFDFSGFPDLGIWSKPKAKAPFVCIEPWCGRADSIGFTGDIKEKYGMIKLNANGEFSCCYKITVG